MPYPTPPAPRIAYDKDGTLAFFKTNVDEGGVFQFPQSFLRFMNTDGAAIAGIRDRLWHGWQNDATLIDTNAAPFNCWVALRFPVAMRIEAVASSMLWVSSNARVNRLNYTIETSSDSSNGQDGTWQPLLYRAAEDDFGGFGTPWLVSNAVDTVGTISGIPVGHEPQYISQAAYPLPETSRPRVNLPGNSDSVYWDIWPTIGEAVPPHRRQRFVDTGRGWHDVSGGASRQVKWLRMRVTAMGANVYSASNYSGSQPQFRLHVYGAPDTSADTQRVSFVTTAGAANPSLDFGDLDPTELPTKQFRIKNNHGSLTAEDVKVSILAANPTLSIPAPDSWCKLSLDGVSWASDVDIASIAPGGTSDIITLRVIPQPGVMGPWSPRMQATVEEWT
jgi:hypothetical protein